LKSSHGVFEVSHRCASLEELFVACTRGIGALPLAKESREVAS
jgi:hypothetical protein